MIKVTICFDGACGYRVGGNLIGIGVVATSNIFEYEIEQTHPYLGNNMVAEWEALIAALKLAIQIEAKHGRCSFEIRGDNQPVIYHMTGKYKDIKTDFKLYAQQAETLSKQLRYKKFKWIPREENTRADILSKYGRIKWFDYD